MIGVMVGAVMEVSIVALLMSVEQLINECNFHTTKHGYPICSVLNNIANQPASPLS